MAKTIVDSLFLELGIDTTKFSQDQQKALAKIQQFEAQTRRSSGKAADSVKTVGQAFHDLAKDSRIGASANRLDSLATKFKNLGVSMQVSGGAGAPFGALASGLGMMLSPAALGIAAISVLGKEVLDFNEKMTAQNATLARNAELSGMATDNLWAMGQATKTVGGNPASVEAGIAALQTSLAGASIGVGSAVPQLIGMARLSGYGARFNKGGFGAGVDEESLFKAVQAMYKAQGRAKTMALVTGYGLMGVDQANLAMSGGGWAEYQKTLAQARRLKAPGGFEGIVRESLKSQVGIGEKDIASAIAAEQAYGGIQKPMQTVVGLITGIYATLTTMLGYVEQIVQFVSRYFTGRTGGIKDLFTGSNADTIDNILSSRSKLPTSLADRMAFGKKTLMGLGMSESDAAAMLGSAAQESGFDPAAIGPGNHRGIFQLDKARQAAFAKRFGYAIGASDVSSVQQSKDQYAFQVAEFATSQRAAFAAMEKTRSLMAKTRAFMDLDERPGDNSFGQRAKFAQQAMGLPVAALDRMLSAVQSYSRSFSSSMNSSEVNISEVNLHTSTTDPKGHADAFAKGIASHPLLNLPAQNTVALSTRAMVN